MAQDSKATLPPAPTPASTGKRKADQLGTCPVDEEEAIYRIHKHIGREFVNLFVIQFEMAAEMDPIGMGRALSSVYGLGALEESNRAALKECQRLSSVIIGLRDIAAELRRDVAGLEKRISGLTFEIEKIEERQEHGTQDGLRKAERGGQGEYEDQGACISLDKWREQNHSKGRS